MTYSDADKAFRAFPADIENTAKEIAAEINASIDPIENVEEAIARAILAERERCALLVEEMIKQHPCSEKPWARMALAIAAKTIRRGRHLTEDERRENLIIALTEDAGGAE